jgi:hypothetical protein
VNVARMGKWKMHIKFWERWSGNRSDAGEGCGLDWMYLGYGPETASYIHVNKLPDPFVAHVDGLRLSPNGVHCQACCSSPWWCMRVESHGGIMRTGETRKSRRKPCLSATSPTTNPTWTVPGANPGLFLSLKSWECLGQVTG